MAAGLGTETESETGFVPASAAGSFAIVVATEGGGSGCGSCSGLVATVALVG